MDGKSADDRNFAFGPFVLDRGSRILLREGREVRLAHRPFDILVHLIVNRDRVVPRSELLDRFWDGHDVYDDALRKSIGAVRKALGDTKRPSNYIETRYGDGYRFVSDLATARVPTALLANGRVRSGSFTPVRALILAASVVILAVLTLGLYVTAPSESSSSATAQATHRGTPRSIAVMPIKNLTGKAETEYFSDGVTDSIITELARAGDLKVISRGSTFSFKGREIDPRELGRELGVDVILEGTLQSKGENVNIRVRLINASDGSIVWTSNDFERRFTAASDLQDTIACSVAAELRLQICGDAGHNTQNGIAYQEYLKGRYEWNKRTPAGIKKSIEHFNRAIEFDPMFSRAYSGLSESYSMGLWYVPFPSEYALPKATEAARRALAIDPDSAEAMTALANAAVLDWRWDEAREMIEKAVTRDANYARAFHVYAFYLTAFNRYDEAIRSIRRAHELDPMNSVIRADTAHILLHGHREDASRIDAAIAECDSLITTDPSYAETYDYRATAYSLKNDSDRFAADLIEAKRIRGEKGLNRFTSAYSSKGKPGLLRLLLADELQLAKNGDPRPMRIAAIYAALGEKASAIDWLTRAVNDHDAEIIGLAQNPWFDILRDDPSFVELLHRAGLAR